MYIVYILLYTCTCTCTVFVYYMYMYMYNIKGGIHVVPVHTCICTYNMYIEEVVFPFPHFK